MGKVFHPPLLEGSEIEPYSATPSTTVMGRGPYGSLLQLLQCVFIEGRRRQELRDLGVRAPAPNRPARRTGSDKSLPLSPLPRLAPRGEGLAAPAGAALVLHAGAPLPSRS